MMLRRIVSASILLWLGVVAATGSQQQQHLRGLQGRLSYASVTFNLPKQDPTTAAPTAPGETLAPSEAPAEAPPPPGATAAPTESSVPVFQAEYRVDVRTLLVDPQRQSTTSECTNNPPAATIHAFCNGTIVLGNLSDPRIACEVIEEDDLEDLLEGTKMEGFSTGLTCRQAYELPALEEEDVVVVVTLNGTEMETNQTESSNSTVLAVPTSDTNSTMPASNDNITTINMEPPIATSRQGDDDDIEEPFTDGAISGELTGTDPSTNININNIPPAVEEDPAITGGITPLDTATPLDTTTTGLLESPAPSFLVPSTAPSTVPTVPGTFPPTMAPSTVPSTAPTQEPNPWTGSLYYTCQGTDVGHVDSAILHVDAEDEDSNNNNNECVDLEYQRISQLSVLCDSGNGNDIQQEYKNEHSFFECQLPSIPLYINEGGSGGTTMGLLCGDQYCNATAEDANCEDTSNHASEIAADHFQFARGCVRHTDPAVQVPQPVAQKPVPEEIEPGTYVAKFRVHYGTLLKDADDWNEPVTGVDCTGPFPTLTLKCGQGQTIAQILPEDGGETEPPTPEIVVETLAPDGNGTLPPTVEMVVTRKPPPLECNPAGQDGLTCNAPGNLFNAAELYQYFNSMGDIVYVSYWRVSFAWQFLYWPQTTVFKKIF